MEQVSDRFYEKLDGAISYANDYLKGKAIMAQLSPNAYGSKIIDGLILTAGALFCDYLALTRSFSDADPSIISKALEVSLYVGLIWGNFYSLNTLRILSKGQNPCVNSPCTNLPIPKALRRK
jgi:hypothetical protein